MIKYTVKISDKAQADMEQIYSYIAKELMSPRNALGQYNCFFIDLIDAKPFISPHKCL